MRRSSWPNIVAYWWWLAQELYRERQARRAGVRHIQTLYDTNCSRGDCHDDYITGDGTCLLCGRHYG